MACAGFKLLNSCVMRLPAGLICGFYLIDFSILFAANPALDSECGVGLFMFCPLLASPWLRALALLDLQRACIATPFPSQPNRKLR